MTGKQLVNACGVLLYLMVYNGMPDACAQTTNAFRKVFIFSLHREIDKPAERLVSKALSQARAQHADAVVMSLNTFGGQLDVADSIRTMLLNCPVPVAVWIEQNAASAGALISIACDSIYMKRGSTIGAASVVNQSGELMPDKYQSYMRGMMRATAEQTGRDPRIAEGMVTPNGALLDIGDSSKIITLTTAEAIRHRYCNGEAGSFDEVLARMHAESAARVYMQLSWTDGFIGFLLNPLVNSLLILVIFGGIYFEMQHPGIGFPLFAAIGAAMLYFAPLYIEGLAANWEILMFVVGLLLLGLEVFVFPGHGVAAILGIAMMVMGLALSLVGNRGFDFSFTAPMLVMLSFFRVVVLLAVLLIVALVFGRSLFQSRLARRMVLTETQTDTRAFVEDTNALRNLIGLKATADTVLRPSGIVMLNDAKYDAFTDGAFVSRDETVTVIDVRGNSLVVRKS